MQFTELSGPWQAGFEDPNAPAVLLCHGFTGSPQSMRPWGEHLAREGFAVRIPLLPGHGTTWQEMARSTWQDWYGALQAAALEILEERDHLAIGGLSMGGALALHLAADPLVRDRVFAMALVNPALRAPAVSVFAPVLAPVVPAVPGIGSDIARPNTTEEAYDRTPMRSVARLRSLLSRVRGELDEISVPMLLATSPADKTVNPTDSDRIAASVRSPVERLALNRSGHVATLDYDADEFFSASTRFFHAHDPVSAALQSGTISQTSARTRG